MSYFLVSLEKAVGARVIYNLEHTFSQSYNTTCPLLSKDSVIKTDKRNIHEKQAEQR
jgi:hypothetical protein